MSRGQPTRRPSIASTECQVPFGLQGRRRARLRLGGEGDARATSSLLEDAEARARQGEDRGPRASARVTLHGLYSPTSGARRQWISGA
jgi:hypothetical protein